MEKLFVIIRALYAAVLFDNVTHHESVARHPNTGPLSYTAVTGAVENL